jgi:epoxide hydrolase-like predicted phosphatase
MGERVTTPTALILDFGGVLTTDLWDSVRSCSRREGLPPEALLDLLGHDPVIHPLFVRLERGEVSQHDFERRLAAAAGVQADGLLARMCADLRPDQQMLDAVATLRDAGVRVGVLSNSWGLGYFDPYDGYSLDERADAVVLSDQVGLRKPEPAIFTLIADKLGVPPAQCVFVDDVAEHLPAAAKLGMRTVHHVHTVETLAELSRIFVIKLG